MSNLDISRVTLEPEGRELNVDRAYGKVQFELDEFTCHQMVALHER